MGTSTSTKQFAKKINELTKVPERVAYTAVAVNVKNAAANAEKAVKDATNGSGRLRNAGALVRAGGNETAKGRVVGKTGAKLSVSKVVTPDRKSGIIAALGPWQLIEYPTKQHFIGPAGLAKTATGAKSGRSGAKAREGRAKALRTPYGIKRWVYVKGTKGKFPWKKARDKTTREAPLAVKKAAEVELAKVFR